MSSFEIFQNSRNLPNRTEINQISKRWPIPMSKHVIPCVFGVLELKFGIKIAVLRFQYPQNGSFHKFFDNNLPWNKIFPQENRLDLFQVDPNKIQTLFMDRIQILFINRV